MRDLDLKSLRLFVAVCDHRNIKAAARGEHIEPSAISKRIAQLEATLGTPLLLRGRRGVQATPAGTSLLEHARSLLHTVDRIEADAAAYAGGIRGHVTLVASMSAIAEALLDDVAAFMRDPANRAINVDIEERLSADVVRLVREGSASLGVCWDSVDMAGLATAPWRGDELVLAVHPSHPLARRRSLRFDETLDHEHVSLLPTTAVYAMLHRAAARAGRTLAHRVVVSTFDAAMRVVAANLGVSVIPREVSAGPVRNGTIVAIPLIDAWARRRFAVCFRERGLLAPAAARMLDHLERRAKAAAGQPSTGAGTSPAAPRRPARS